MNSDKFFYVIVTVFTVLALFGIIFFASKSSPKKTSTKIIDSKELIGENSHVKGDLQNAQVVVVEFGDFQCPACKAMEPVVKQIFQDFPDKVAFVYRHYPLVSIHNYAFNASIASEAAGKQGKFFEYYDLLYQRQRESNNPLKDEDFISFAEELGLDTEQFKQDLNDSALKKKVQEDMSYARSLGLPGTPTFFVNGELVSNNELYSKVKSLLSSDTDSDK